jgi:hypothetical protein
MERESRTPGIHPQGTWRAIARLIDAFEKEMTNFVKINCVEGMMKALLGRRGYARACKPVG